MHHGNQLVRQGAHWLMQDLHELIDAFGFYSHQVSNDALLVSSVEFT
jgi:hypothetical protein